MPAKNIFSRKNDLSSLSSWLIQIPGIQVSASKTTLAHKILCTLNDIHEKPFFALTSNMVNRQAAEKVKIFKSALLPPEWFSSLSTFLQDARVNTPGTFATPSRHGLCGQALKFLQ